MNKVNGILGAVAVLLAVADILLFVLTDNSFKDEPLAIFTGFVESVGGE